MLTIPHMIAGAALGSLVGDVPGQPFFAFTVGWGSHYVLDALPHWERLFGNRGSDFDTRTPASQWPKSYLYQAIGDVLIAVSVIIGALIWRGEFSTFWQSPIFWGAVGGFFPDLIDNTPVINNMLGRYGFVQKERQFHQDNHISKEAQARLPKFTGLVTQLAVIAISLWILF